MMIYGLRLRILDFSILNLSINYIFLIIKSKRGETQKEKLEKQKYKIEKTEESRLLP